MTINKYLRYAIIAILFLSLFIPFIVAPTFFFPFITGKNFIFRLLAELAFGLWIILALRDERVRPRFSYLAAALAIFVAVIGIADALSPNGFKSFWSNFERMEGYVTILHLFAYFLVASSVLNTQKLWERFFQTSIGASVIMGIYGIFQLLGKFPINQGGVRLDGRLGNASYLAAFMLLNFFLALFLLVRAKRSVAWRSLYGIAMALQLFILYHTATRGAILGVLVGLLLAMLLLILLSRAKTHRRWGIAVAGFVILVAVLGAAFKNSEFVKNQPSLARLTSISASEAGPRFMVWNMAWQGFKESPKTALIGWGQESFNYVFNKYYDPKMYNQEQWFDRTHNIIFDWLIAGGLLGLLAYLSILLCALYYIWKQGEVNFSLTRLVGRFFKRGSGEEETVHVLEKSVLTGLLVAYVFQNLFVFDNITSYLLFFSVLAYLHSISSRPITQISIERLSPASVTSNRVVVPLVAVATIFVMYVLNASPVRAGTTLIDALQPQSTGPEKNLEYFKQTLGLNSFGNAEAREQLAQKSTEVIYAQSVNLTLKQQYYDLTRSELLKQIERTPLDARYYLFLGSFLNRVRNHDEAIGYLLKALELSPKKQTIMFELGSAYINKGAYRDALAIMKKAFELEPDFSEARIIYATAAIYAKDFTLADTLLTPLALTTSEYDERVVRAYAASGRLAKVVELLEKRIARAPLDPQARLELAGAYLDSGSRDKAIAVLRKMLVDFPGQKDQADYYIREIQAGRHP